jgi:UDP-hydrolysing UDP-N-acetyl-D-glucosamine 2-epimerase
VCDKRKICVVTGSRAEYGILRWIIEDLQADQEVTLQLVVTGAHLVPDLGSSYKEIEKDGFRIDRKVEMVLRGDTNSAIGVSYGLGAIGLSNALNSLAPDITILVGDRYEALSAAVAALLLHIPIAHLHGGECTQQVIDEQIRHAITKLAHLHFTSTEAYRKRVIRMGEHPSRVFNVGAPSLESLTRLSLLGKPEIESRLGIKLSECFILLTFHPVSYKSDFGLSELIEIIAALKSYSTYSVVATLGNTDSGGMSINARLTEEIPKIGKASCVFPSLGTLGYLSVLQHASVVVGNSSSGIIEAAAVKTPTINVGGRQQGRIQPQSVINVEPERREIARAVSHALTLDEPPDSDFWMNPYGDGSNSQKIVNAIKEYLCGRPSLTKEFFDDTHS